MNRQRGASSDLAEARIQLLAPNAVRITRYARHLPPDRPWLRHVLLPIDPKGLADPSGLDVDVREGIVHVQTHEGMPILTEAHTPRQSSDGHIHLALRIARDEGFYGWGEWFSAFRRERSTVTLRANESPSFFQGRQTYSTIPFFLSSRGYGFFLLNGYESHWSIKPEQGVLEIDVAGPPAAYIVIYGPAWRDIVMTYTALTGRPPLLPRWTFGLWVTGYPQEDQARVLALVDEHRRRALPLDAIILDYHWEEGFHNFRWRRSLFPRPEQLVADLRARGVRLGLIFTPFVNNRQTRLKKAALNLVFHNVPHGLEQDDERALPEYDEARALGYLAHDHAAWWFGEGGMLDFSHPEAARWWNDHLRPLYDQGVAFFKNDDGEYLSDDARSHLGMDGREYHNLYGFFYGKAIYEGMAALDDRRPLIYARSVWAGSQRYPAMFLGDQNPTFGCIRRTMRAGLNVGLAGFAYWTADIFGLDGKTTPETHMRYAQWALMAPIARYFVRPADVDDSRFPWSHGPQAEANFRKYTELRYRLLPYYCALAWEAYRTGLPIMRPLLLEFQADARVADVWDQVMLGDRLMLAPVIEQGATSRRIVLPGTPEEVWHDFWTGDTFEGGCEVECAAPLECLPLLVRGGTLLPMLASAPQHIADDLRFDPIQVHLWPPFAPPAECRVYDDDGTTRAYERGTFSVTRIKAEGDCRRVVVCIEPAQGEWPAQVERRQVELVLHSLPEPSEVHVNGPAGVSWTRGVVEGHPAIAVGCVRREPTIVEMLWPT